MNVYKQALNVQDACNPSGVANLFFRACSEIRDTENAETEALCTHPALILIADKLIDLMGRPQDIDYVKAYYMCKNHGKGA